MLLGICCFRVPDYITKSGAYAKGTSANPGLYRFGPATPTLNEKAEQCFTTNHSGQRLEDLSTYHD